MDGGCGKVLHEIMGRKTDAAVWRSKVYLSLHWPRQPGIDLGLGGPDAMIEAGKDDDIGTEKPCFKEAHDGKARVFFRRQAKGASGEFAIEEGCIIGGREV